MSGKYKIISKEELAATHGDTSTRKWIEWDDNKVDLIQSLILNGYKDEDIAKQLDCSPATYRARVKQQPDIKAVFDNAKKTAIANSTKALQKIAEGYHEYEVTYGNEFKKRKELSDLINKLITYAPKTKQKSFLEKAEKLLSEGEIIRKTKKWYPPNKDAINKILDAHKGEVWDTEMRRKQIPQVKLNVTLDEKQLKARKAVKPDFEIVD